MFSHFFLLWALILSTANFAHGALSKTTVDMNWESYLQGSVHDVRSSVLNTGNQTLGLPSERVGVDLRPEFTATNEGVFKAVARPRARAFYQRGSGVTDSSFTRFHFDEASVHWNATRKLEFLAGIHYVQWGPAELFSPSNPLIHFFMDQRSITFRMRGKALVEADYYFDSKNFVSFIAEPISNGEPDWITGYKFTPRGLVRWERQTGDNPGNYLGMTVGRMERKNTFISAYANAYLSELSSFYFDARLSPGSPTLYPDLTAPSGVSPGVVNHGKWNSLTTVGLRYEGFFDTRFEYILNTYGYNPSQWRDALTLARLNPAAGAVSIAAGTELPRQHYLYASLRTDRLGKGDEWRLSLRYLHSLADHSGAVFTALEWNFNSYCTAILEPMLTHGRTDDEFAQLTRADLFGSLRIAL